MSIFFSAFNDRATIFIEFNSGEPFLEREIVLAPVQKYPIIILWPKPAFSLFGIFFYFPPPITVKILPGASSVALYSS